MNEDELTLYVVRALWGHVPPSLRAVSFEMNDGVVRFQCIFDVEASEDDKELLSMAGTEFVADLPADYQFEEEISILPFPNEIKNLKHLVFYRHEHNYYK